jgi:hypothetical protein
LVFLHTFVWIFDPPKFSTTQNLEVPGIAPDRRVGDEWPGFNDRRLRLAATCEKDAARTTSAANPEIPKRGGADDMKRNCDDEDLNLLWERHCDKIKL